MSTTSKHIIDAAIAVNEAYEECMKAGLELSSLGDINAKCTLMANLIDSGDENLAAITMVEALKIDYDLSVEGLGEVASKIKEMFANLIKKIREFFKTIIDWFTGTSVTYKDRANAHAERMSTKARNSKKGTESAEFTNTTTLSIALDNLFRYGLRCEELAGTIGLHANSICNHVKGWMKGDGDHNIESISNIITDKVADCPVTTVITKMDELEEDVNNILKTTCPESILIDFWINQNNVSKFKSRSVLLANVDHKIATNALTTETRVGDLNAGLQHIKGTMEDVGVISAGLRCIPRMYSRLIKISKRISDGRIRLTSM